MLKNRPVTRVVVSLVAVVAIVLGSTTAAWAGMPWPWKLEGTWYKSKISCQSRGKSLVGMGSIYNAYRCLKDEYSQPGRWSLWVKISFSGTGGGSWIRPAG